tara:strand:- start:226 stop:1044 length:819 start_codon:yes stop_codon:yes gene_type:complete
MNVPTTVGWEQWFLLSSDRHHDNAHTDHALERRHLEQAVERGAGIIDAGDLHCAMQGKWDRRQDRCALREEYQGGDYLDALVREAANFYGTSAANWIVMGRGNHEQAIYKHHETDLVERTVEAIKTKSPETPLVAGGYGGWIVFRIKRTETCSHIIRLKYFHGAGGGGPVTRGVIQTNRMAVYLPDADIVLTGHTHDAWMVPIARERISARGTISHDEQVHIRSSTYKDEYGDGHSGWHVETMKPPKPRGAWWLRFYFNDKETLAWQAIRAT